MTVCAIKWCINRSDRNKKDADITFHRIPIDPIAADKWINIIRLSHNKEWWKPTKHTRICSNHFHDADKYFTKDGLCRVRRNAIPAMNLHISCREGYVRNGSDNNETSPSHTLTELPIIVRVYLYLEKEYEYMKELNGNNNCDLSPLADILKRTAEATGVEEEEVIDALENENLSDHLPERVERKHNRKNESEDDDDQAEDDDMMEEEDDTEEQIMCLIDVEPDIKLEPCTAFPGRCSDAVSDKSGKEEIEIKLEPQDLGDPLQTSLDDCSDSCVSSQTAQPSIKIESDQHEITTSKNKMIFEQTTETLNAIQMEDITDIYENQQQQQTEFKMQSIQIRPYSNAERQRRYRERRKAYKMNAFNKLNDVRQEKSQHNIQINKRIQSNDERQQKSRKFDRQQLQQIDDTSIDQLKNVDQARQERKRHLNKMRQSRFRARQRFEWSSLSSHQPQTERYKPACPETSDSSNTVKLEPQDYD